MKTPKYYLAFIKDNETVWFKRTKADLWINKFNKGTLVGRFKIVFELLPDIIENLTNKDYKIMVIDIQKEDIVLKHNRRTMHPFDFCIICLPLLGYDIDVGGVYTKSQLH
jgi:hypothetical protein